MQSNHVGQTQQVSPGCQARSSQIRMVALTWGGHWLGGMLHGIEWEAEQEKRALLKGRMWLVFHSKAESEGLRRGILFSGVTGF